MWRTFLDTCTTTTASCPTAHTRMSFEHGTNALFPPVQSLGITSHQRVAGDVELLIQGVVSRVRGLQVFAHELEVR